MYLALAHDAPKHQLCQDLPPADSRFAVCYAVLLFVQQAPLGHNRHLHGSHKLIAEQFLARYNRPKPACLRPILADFALHAIFTKRFDERVDIAEVDERVVFVGQLFLVLELLVSDLCIALGFVLLDFLLIPSSCNPQDARASLASRRLSGIP